MFVTSVYYMIGCDFLLNKCVAYLLLVWEMLKPRLRFSVYALCLSYAKFLLVTLFMTFSCSPCYILHLKF